MPLLQQVMVQAVVLEAVVDTIQLLRGKAAPELLTKVFRVEMGVRQMQLTDPEAGVAALVGQGRQGKQQKAVMAALVCLQVLQVQV
jgi:hypothetical protein